MANILDIRRRIRSVTNTRQITRAMKMVSAARLRRAQERALAARPYAQMLTNVLKSLVSRADVYDPVTGEALHPLLVHRPEKNVVLIVVTGDKGLAEHHGMQARISSWKADKGPPPAKGDPDLELAKPEAPAVKPPTIFPEMPWKKKT